MMGSHGPKWHSVTVKRIKDPISGTPPLVSCPFPRASSLTGEPVRTGESAFLVSEMDITAKKKLEKENSDKDTFLGMVRRRCRSQPMAIIVIVFITTITITLHGRTGVCEGIA